ncbi:DUF4913 domain-containing protein [Streptomyces sp. NPDC006610]|jgi:hypothetical protein|uniref:DUF4913 domain-containing protein n=1 Tax=Streptomyces sp. NPDC006610 TaxID=3154584 RepID=UPI00339FFBCF
MTEHLPHQVPQSPPFILYLDGDAYVQELRLLATWVNSLLLPVYGRETHSGSPWCPRWWEHLEAVARLHALWLAWQELTDPAAGAVGPSVWQRDHLGPALSELRDPAGPFAGCKEGSHRAKAAPVVEPY